MSSQHQGTHLHCLSVRYPTVNRYLRHCLSSCCSTSTGSTACGTTTTTAVATTITTASRSGRSSSSSSSVRGTTTAGSCGARGGGGPGTVGRGGRGPWLTLHGALCSSHLWPPALLNGSPVPEEKKREHMRKKWHTFSLLHTQTQENKMVSSDEKNTVGKQKKKQ